MTKSHLIASAAVLAACLAVTATPCAAEERTGELRGKFVRVTEKVVGDREYVGIVLQPLEKDAQVTVLFSRSKADMLDLARRLRPGQKLEIAFVREGGHLWLKRIQAERLAGGAERAERRERAERAERVERARRDRERPDRPRLTSPELRELSAMIDRLQQGLQRIQREMNELREENARLRRLLSARESKAEARDRPKADGDKPDKPKDRDR